MKKKRIGYLFGAGASHAVVKALDSTKGLMTADIQRVIEREDSGSIDPVLWNELVSTGRDVEHIISVVESMYDSTSSIRLRELYQGAIVQLTEAAVKNVPRNNLYSVLADIHFNGGGTEELAFFATLNYEDLLERTLTTHYAAAVDYKLLTRPRSPKRRRNVDVYKLHGSFNWKNQRPVNVADMFKLKPHEPLWIPPGVDKRRENYPFNLLWGSFTEALMECDVLRIVGCSLSRNDWSLIPVLYAVQKLTGRKPGLSIEMIAGVETVRRVQQTYKYLDLKSMCECEEMMSSWKTKFPHAPESEVRGLMESHFKGGKNYFSDWLDAKIEHMIEVEKKDMVRAKVAHNFYYRAA